MCKGYLNAQEVHTLVRAGAFTATKRLNKKSRTSDLCESCLFPTNRQEKEMRSWTGFFNRSLSHRGAYFATQAFPDEQAGNRNAQLGVASLARTIFVRTADFLSE